MRVLRLALTLIICLALTLVGIRLLSNKYKDSIALLFTNPDGSSCRMPCLFGVRPDDMTIDQPLQVLTAHPLTKNIQRQSLKAEDGTQLGFPLHASSIEVRVTNSQPYKEHNRHVDDNIYL